MIKISKKITASLALFSVLIGGAFSSLLPCVMAVPQDANFLNLNNFNATLLGNGTMPIYANTQNASFEAQLFFWNFLSEVAGINATSYDASKFYIEPTTASGSNKSQTAMSAIISKGQTKYEYYSDSHARKSDFL